MPYPHEHHARLEDPARYTRFRCENDQFGSGIHAIWGGRGVTAEGTPELLEVRFDADKFTVAQAKEWLKEHGHKPVLIVTAGDIIQFDAEEMRKATQAEATAAEATAEKAWKAEAWEKAKEEAEAARKAWEAARTAWAAATKARAAWAAATKAREAWAAEAKARAREAMAREANAWKKTVKAEKMGK